MRLSGFLHARMSELDNNLLSDVHWGDKDSSPVIISDCMAHWPAMTRWNDIDYLKRVAGFRTVPVENI
ncbi:unnamed protein product [Thlaspi arvense]|uniref:Cupin-like domain-containing protein n=1 Tax=Thlaspi arvense TaxID=13288 RepID=A0AAU9SHU6_THLAR|nr:unnamed protein product [Thlaspi arvense]